MNIIRFIQNIFNWKSVKDAFLDFVLIGFFTMLASIIKLIIMLKNSDLITWEEFYKDGNFFLYAISLFSSSLIYYLHKENNKFGKYSVMILITLCAIIYSQFVNNQTSNSEFTKYGSLIFIIFAFLAFIIAQYNQYLRIEDLNHDDKENQNRIASGVIFNNKSK